jgi:hypothetical protein
MSRNRKRLLACMYPTLSASGCCLILSICVCSLLSGSLTYGQNRPDWLQYSTLQKVNKDDRQKPEAHLDTSQYNLLLLHLVHGKPSSKWPVRCAYPMPGAILPFKRIVAYYGNFYSKGMGILGELPPDKILSRLQEEVKKWEIADPQIRVQPAIHYIAVTAQRNAGRGKKYRLRMPFSQIDKAMLLAKQIDAIVFLDVQVGHSTLQEELPALESYLSLPNVHLAIDPEFSMKGDEVPCSVIGTFGASDINYASEYLAQLTNKYNIPPKILIVHRFNKEMVTDYRKILTRPQVQIVMNMDGFGFPAKKIDSYINAIANEPVQFTGFKLFYKNDLFTPGWKTLMQPNDILDLYPSPIYIQYQ